MNIIFKRLGVLATNSKATNFKGAVIRLTFYYSLGVFFLLTIFSLIVYGLFSVDIEQRKHEERERSFDDVIQEGDEDEFEFYEEAAENLVDILLIADTVLLLVTVLVSYALARRTLLPLSIAYAQQRQFIADAAHELRTPLAIMKAGAEVLLDRNRTVDEYKKFVEESEEEINRLIELSHDLLFLASHTEAASSAFEKNSLSNICDIQCRALVPYALRRHVTVVTDIESNVFVESKKNDLSRLVLNVLKNAVDYNIQNGTVTIRLCTIGRWAELSVKDSGIGIAADNLPFIFDRFYKADSARVATKSSGSGLGLSIVREIVRSHKGKISVESTIGKGTRVIVLLPCV